MRLPKLAIENHQFTIIIFIALIIFGLYATFEIPRSEDPKVSFPAMAVFAIYPGASPETIEDLIVDPIEEAIAELNDIKKLRSTITSGVVSMIVEFEYDSDHDKRKAELRDKVNGVKDKLPKNLYLLDVVEMDLTTVNIAQIAVNTDSASYSDLYQISDKLKTKLERIKGVKNVDIMGFPKEIVRIDVDIHRLNNFKLSLEDIENAILSRNANIPGGKVLIQDRVFSVRTSGSYENIEDIKKTIISAKNQQPIYLEDLASVYFDYEENLHIAKFNGKKSVFVNVQQKYGSDIFQITSEIKEIVNAVEKGKNIDVNFAFDQSLGVQKRINLFASNLGQGIFLVALVIFIAVGYRAASIISIAIPVSFIIGIGFLNANDIGIQQMSIAGMIIALGLLVDNAIVVMENIHVFLKKGYVGAEAAIKATQQVAWPIISSTVTTIFAFFPMLMMYNSSGDFIRSMPIMVVITLLVSLFISLTLTPFLSSRFFASKDFNQENRFQKHLEAFIKTNYRERISWSLKNPKRVLAISLVIFILSLSLFPFLGVSMFPKAEKNQFLVNIRMAKGINIEKTESIVDQVESVIENIPELESYATNIANTNPKIYYNSQDIRNADNFSQIMISIDEEKGRSITEIVHDLRNIFTEFPSGRIEILEFEQGPYKAAPIAIRVVGNDMAILKKLADDVEKMIEDVDGSLDIYNPLKVSSTDLQVNINKEKAAILGLPLHRIDETVRSLLTGKKLSSYRDNNGDEYPINMRLPIKDKANFFNFNDVYISNVLNEAIPLSQVAKIEFIKGHNRIEHHLRERSITVTSNVDGRLVNDVTNDIIDKLENYNWPKEYRYIVAGEKAQQAESFGGMAMAAVMALVLIYGVLVLQFRSFIQPLVVFSAIPLAIIGSIIALLITGNSFSFTAFVGLTSLIGIVVNNSILLVDTVNQYRKQNMSIGEALREAAEARFTPIILTTATTIGGLLPLTLFGGSMWGPMGWTIIGGLLASTLLTLIIVPVLYKSYLAKEA